jgi:Holliday junction resolvase-like predicted endonuclease
MNTTGLGTQAEQLVTEELLRQGYELIARNWKRRVCEIDIIASKDRVVVFVEVKFRSSLAQGRGLDYITAKKLKQLKFAAEIWVNENNWTGDCRLLAASVRNEEGGFMVEEILEIN